MRQTPFQTSPETEKLTLPQSKMNLYHEYKTKKTLAKDSLADSKFLISHRREAKCFF